MHEFIHIKKATKGLFLCLSHKPSGTGHENHYDAIVDLESIPFRPIVTQATPATQATKTTQAAKTTPNHPHAKLKHWLPNLPLLPEFEETLEHFDKDLEPKIEPEEEPKPEFEQEKVPEPEFEPKLEPDFEPHFQVPNTPNSTTPEPSMHQLSQILPPRETEFIPPSAVHQKKWVKSTINMSAFSNVTPEVVDRMPWIPDGDHIYLIRCEEDYWHDKQISGQPWQMTKSSCEGLNGIKKFGTC